MKSKLKAKGRIQLKRILSMKGKKEFCLGMILILSSSVFGGEIRKTVSFPIENLILSKAGEYDIVDLNGYPAIASELGEPRLPRVGQALVIPPGAIPTGVEIVSQEITTIKGNYNIIPAHPDVSLPMPGKTFTPQKIAPNPTIYSLNTPYPETEIRITGTGKMNGYQLVNIELFPVRYIPNKKILQMATSITYKLKYIETKEPMRIPTTLQREVFGNTVRSIVVNPEDVSYFAPTVGMFYESPLLPSGNYQYVIITQSPMDTVFNRLAEWKTKKGIPTTVVTVDWINANYTGYDTQERIRNFIIDAKNTWGTIYVLLGGQGDHKTTGQNIVPARRVFYIRSRVGYYSDEDTLPCDLYYSDLNGTWDADGDYVYGERSDNVDMYADVYVGRASVYNIGQAQNFVYKVLTYEKNPPFNYIKKLMLPTAILWDEYDERPTQDSIARIVPAGWVVAKMYERNGTLSRQGTIDSLNIGYALGHWEGHGNEYGIYIGTNPYLNSDDADGLINGDKVGIVNSIACFTGAWDQVPGGDCFAEHLVNREGSGLIAAMMNSRYGWGAYVWGVGYVTGPSERIDTTFYAKIFQESMYCLGMVHGVAKDAWVVYADSNQQYDFTRWCIYNLNLFGDPTLSIWTDIPEGLNVTYNPTVPLGPSNFVVTVTNKNTGVLVESALVCCMMDSTVYARGYTDPTGTVTLSISPVHVDTLWVTTTAHNYIPDEGCALVAVPHVAYLKHSIDDDNLGSSNGNGNGIIEAGETIELLLWAKNYGADTTRDVEGKISTSDAFITITDSIEMLGTIVPEDSGQGSYIFSVNSNVPDNHSVQFILTFKDVLDSVWLSSFDVLVRHFSTISGQIIDARTGLGIPGAVVTYNGPSYGADTATASGNYEIINLPGGTYTLIASATGFFNSAPVNVTVPPDTVINFVLRAPDIEISPESLGAELVLGDITSHIMIIKNIGTSTLTFSIEESLATSSAPSDVEWLSKTPTSGSLPPGELDTILVTFDATGLVPDTTYKAYLKINSNDLDKPVVSVPVSLTTLFTRGDVGPVAIFGLPDTVYVDSTYPFTARVTNFGINNVISFKVIGKIDTFGYSVVADTQVVTSLAGGDTVTIYFTDWQVPKSRVDYTAIVITKFLLDTVPGNDTLSIIVYEVNDPPIITYMSPASPCTIGVDTLTLLVRAEDIDKDSLRYIWRKNGGTDPSAMDTIYHYWSEVTTVDTMMVEVTDLSLSDSATWIISVDVDPPSQVIIDTPAQDAYLNDSIVTFTWYSSSDVFTGVAYYVLQCALDDSFSTILIDTMVNDTTFTTVLRDTIYYWHVKAVDRAGNEGSWSSTFKFEVDTRTPPVPTLVSPTHGVWISSTSVVFEWNAVRGMNLEWSTDEVGDDVAELALATGAAIVTTAPVRYVLQVDTSNSFATPIVDTTQFTKDTLTLPEGRYYWRVKTYDLARNEGNFSVPFWFGIDTTGPQVTVIRPDSGEILIASLLDTIRWIATDANPIDSVSIHLSLDNGSTYPYTIIRRMPNISRYVWQVIDTFATTCRIKVVAWDVANNVSEDESDYSFVITYGEKGDVDGNGEVNILDVTRTVEIIQGRAPSPTPYELWAADVNGDGEINIIDIIAIIRIIQGKALVSVIPTDNQLISTSYCVSTDTAVVSILSDTCAPGDSINVYVNLSNAVGVAGVQIRIEYDSLLITARPGKVTSRSTMMSIDSKIEKDYLQILLFNMALDTIASGTGPIIEIPIYVSPNALSGDSTLLHIDRIILSDIDANEIPSQAVDRWLYFTVGVEMAPLPIVYGLSHVYPNPAKRQVVIDYQLPLKGKVSLRVYDISGKLVKTLVAEEKEAGYYRVMWDMKDNTGRRLSSGIYLYRLETDKFKFTRKLTILK